MAATIADRITPGASAVAVAIDGRKAFISSADTRGSLLFAQGDRTGDVASLETRRHGGGNLRGGVYNGDTGRFQRLTLRRVTSGVAGDDRAGMTHFLARRGGGACDESNHRLALYTCLHAHDSLP